MPVSKERKRKLRRISEEDRRVLGRLRYIRRLLDLEISEEWLPKQKASLEIELIWLEFRTGEITLEERQFCLQKKLDVWEKEEPDLFNWLIGENGNGLNPLSRIRDRVIPSRGKRSYFSER